MSLQLISLMDFPNVDLLPGKVSSPLLLTTTPVAKRTPLSWPAIEEVSRRSGRRGKFKVGLQGKGKRGEGTAMGGRNGTKT